VPGCEEIFLSDKILVLVQNSGNLDTEETKIVNFLEENGHKYEIADPSSILMKDPSLYKVIYFRTQSEPKGYNQKDILEAIKSAVERGSTLFLEYYGAYLGQYIGWGKVKIEINYFNPIVKDSSAFVKPITSHYVFEGISLWDPPSQPDRPEQLLWELTKTNTSGSLITFGDVSGEKHIEMWQVYMTYNWNNQKVDTEYCNSWGGCTNERVVKKAWISYTEIGLGKLIFSPITLTEGKDINIVSVGIGGCYLTNLTCALGPAGKRLLNNLLNWAKNLQ
jgi:hypothetical protein